MRRLMMIVEGSPYPEYTDEEWAEVVAAIHARKAAAAAEVPTPAEVFDEAWDEARANSGIDPAGKVSLHIRGEREVELLHIVVRRGSQGQGIASRLMTLLCDLADEHGITLRLGIASDADEDTGLSQEDLHEWYQRNGFVGGTQMVREPNGNDVDQG